jgi:hypothetical protein
MLQRLASADRRAVSDQAAVLLERAIREATPVTKSEAR